MKRLFAILLLALFPLHAQTIGQVANAGCGSATSCSAQFVNPISAGEGILVGSFINPSVQTCLAPTDNDSNTYQQVAVQQQLPHFAPWGACFWVACNISVSLHNPPLVQQNYSAASSTNIRTMELQGAAASCLDQGQSTTIADTGAVNNPFFSQHVTTTQPNELVVGLSLADNGVLHAGTGTNYLDPSGPSSAAIIFNGYSVTTTGSYTSSFYSSAAHDDTLIFVGTFVGAQGTSARRKHPPFVIRFKPSDFFVPIWKEGRT
jgi:hypothetical protein